MWGITRETTLPELSSKSLEIRKVFADAANEVFDVVGEDRAIQIGLSEVNKHLRNKRIESQQLLKKKQEEERNKEIPLHLKALILAKEEKEKERIESDIQKSEIGIDYINEIKKILDESIIDIKPDGEYVILIYKSGKRVKRKLADYNIDARVVTAIDNKPYYEPASGFNESAIPEVYFMTDGDIVMLQTTYNC